MKISGKDKKYAYRLAVASVAATLNEITNAPRGIKLTLQAIIRDLEHQAGKKRDPAQVLEMTGPATE